MKKLISCLLAVLLVCSLMSMNAFAATATSTTTKVDGKVEEGYYWVVGEQGKDENIDNGKPDFPDTQIGSDILINFTASNNGGSSSNETMQDRYAIDINYFDLVIDLTNMTKADDGTLLDVVYVWDVNAHEYVEMDSNGNEVSEEDANADPIQINAFAITNHSSKSIYYASELDNEVSTTMTMEISDNNDGVITRATTGSATTGTTETITAKPAGETAWVDAINSLAGNKATGDKIGAITITVSMEEIA